MILNSLFETSFKFALKTHADALRKLITKTLIN